MPSPVGHALGGLVAGWLADRGSAGASLPRALLFAAAGTAADLDLLVGGHRGPTHGLGAALLAGAVVWALASRAQPPASRLRLGGAVAAAWGSHTLLDWLGSDTTPPIGVMALWPLSLGFYESPLHLFSVISRRYWLAGFWVSNLRAVAREILILGPLVAAVYLVRRRAIRRRI